MAHFAKINNSNIVEEVIVIHNNAAPSEMTGKSFIKNVLKKEGTWLKTSYNTNEGSYYTFDEQGRRVLAEDQTRAFRGNFANQGGTWNPDLEVFLPPKPFESWVLHNQLPKWQSPIGDAPALTSEQESQKSAGTHYWEYVWDEANTQWLLIDHLAQ